MTDGPPLRGLPPLVGERPRLLILGNMPSALSLAAGEYYGNPRNAFWRITADLFGFDPALPYRQRAAALCAAGVAVWDVLRECRRTGSLDAAIRPDSMVPNDFERFFAEHPGIRRVLFNGAAAERNFARLVRPRPRLAYLRLPSTSPAQTMPFAAKLAAWRAGVADHRDGA